MKPIRNLPLIALLFALPCLAQLDPADNQIWVQGAFGVPGDAEGNDSFGSDLAAGDANNDGAMDLAVASVGENNGRGRVTIIHGGRMGLTGAGSVEFDQDNNDIEGNDEANDNFGSAIAFGDFNGDRFDDLAVGVSGEDNSTGIVHILPGSAAGITARGSQVLSRRRQQGDLEGNDDRDDLLGRSLAVGNFNGDAFDDLAIGVPGENGFDGAVNIVFGSPNGLSGNGNQRLRQGDNGLDGNREDGDGFGLSVAAGDFNKDGIDDLAIGVPGEDGGDGIVQVAYGSRTGITGNGSQVLSQGDRDNSFPLPDRREGGDGFGEVLAAGDTNNDGYQDLAVSSLGEDGNEGIVIVVLGSAGGLAQAGSQLWRQGQDGLPDRPENGDRFGSDLSFGDFNEDGFQDLAIGVRGEDGNRGIVHVLNGGPNGLTADGNQLFAQGTDGILDEQESSDSFGSSLVAGDFGYDFADDLAISVPRENGDRGLVHAIYGLSSRAPVISGVQGAGLSEPQVTTASFNAILTLFGQNYPAPVTGRITGSADLVNGRLPTKLDDVCVDMDGARAGLFHIFPGQISIQALTRPGQTTAQLQVILNCDLPNEIRSNLFEIAVASASPQFFFFVNNLDGVNPIAAVNHTTGAFVGSPGIRPDITTRPARPGDTVILFLTGLGETAPRFEPGVLPNEAGRTVFPVRVMLGDREVQAIYAGVTPFNAGLYQLSFTIREGLPPGNYQVTVTVLDPSGAITSPVGGFIVVE